ncbi:hypothetical protein [Streptomyces sp. NBC_00207]|uniref:hypothetical protein n=1 Tax=unclassified Streptomyces TaxID=2593676 RepID=UPI002883E2CD|nr:hypothetical protein [Streptomyces sp. DSM 41633]
MKVISLGLDIGQARDRTVLAGLVPHGRRNPARTLPRWTLALSAAARPGTRYADVATWVCDTITDLSGAGWEAVLTLDRGGIGRAVHERITDQAPPCDVLAVHAHGGQKITGSWEEGFGVPKGGPHGLVTCLHALIEQKAVTVPAALDDSAALRDELTAYAFHTSPTGRTQYRAAGTASDDRVSALQLAAWTGEYVWAHAAEQRGLTPPRTAPRVYSPDQP